MNKVLLVGRITKDPEVRRTNNDVAFVGFTLAINRRFKNSQTGEREADFIQCSAFRSQAEFMEKFVKKGAMLSIEGSMRVRKVDDNGATRSVTDVIVEDIAILDSNNKERGETSDDNKETQELVANAQKRVKSDDLGF